MQVRTCAVGLISYQGKYLICKMPQNRGVYPGQWGIPGGGLNDGETMEEGLRREVLEEVGLEISNIRPFYFSDDQREKMMQDGTKTTVYMVYLVFDCEATSHKVKLNEEFEEYAWVSLSEVWQYDLNEATKKTFTKKEEELESVKQTPADAQIWLNNPTGLIPRGSVCPHCARYNSRNSVGHALVVTDNQVLMILRAQEPMAGYWAIPGGYIDWDETMEDCALRELREESGLIGSNPELFGIYSNPKRDKDGRQNVGVVYLITEIEKSVAETPEEVTQVKWFPLNELPDNIAFDHRQIIEDYKLVARS